MGINVKDILDKDILTDKDKDFFKEFIEKSFVDETTTLNKYRNAVLIYMSKTIANHKEALNKAAEAANTYSARLCWATWALVIATAVLALTGIFQLIISCQK